MRSQSIYMLRILVFILVLADSFCDRNKVKRMVELVSDAADNVGFQNITNNEGRGFFPSGGIFSLGKVLNFFPVGGDKECSATKAGAGAARSGICLNPYDCRQRDGRAAGDCAKGLGVCCVFEVSCGGVVQNNITYFVSPGFPELWPGEDNCDVTIEKVHAGIAQLRIDFIHFNIGQPNRSTGACDEDVMHLSSGKNQFKLCGQNHGQHIYYTLSTDERKSRQEAMGDLAGAGSALLSIRPRGPPSARLWLLRFAQLPLAQAAPHDCLQYYTADNGTITTFNFADNGRHLAPQDYRACIRRNANRCGVRYVPCSSRAFRIGPSDAVQSVMDPGDVYEPSGPAGQGGSGTGFYGPDGSFAPFVSTTSSTVAAVPAMDQQVADTENDPVASEGMMPAQGGQTQQDDIEGSGDDPNVAQSQANTVTTQAPPSMASRIWSFMWPSWIWGQRHARNLRWSPYAQHYGEIEDMRFFGYGNFGNGLNRYGRQRCDDRITIPCDNEYFISSSAYGPGVCDPHHCGGVFCPGQSFADCRIETSVSPFAVSIHFGPPVTKRSAEENIGACLRYTQMPCDS